MFTLAFWKAATERAVKSGAQFTLLTLGGGIAAGVGGNETINAFLLDYPTLGGVFLGGVVVSYLTSIVSAPIGGHGPSLTDVEQITE
jgi:hypothetical protein